MQDDFFADCQQCFPSPDTNTSGFTGSFKNTLGAPARVPGIPQGLRDALNPPWVQVGTWQTKPILSQLVMSDVIC